MILLLWLCVLLSCNSTKQTTDSKEATKVEESASLCQELVTAKDFSGLDGCSMMFINPQGEKLLLAENIPEYKIKEGSQYKIGYKTLEGMMSVCMVENKIIQLTCIEVSNSNSYSQDCKPSVNGFDDPFLKSLISQNSIVRIERFDYGSAWAYKVNSYSKNWLYNCKGKALCEGDLKNFSECFATFKSELSNPSIIFQAEGPKE